MARNSTLALGEIQEGEITRDNHDEGKLLSSENVKQNTSGKEIIKIPDIKEIPIIEEQYED